MSVVWSQWELGKTYSRPGVAYECPELAKRVVLECYFTLEHEQGGEGILFPSSTCVRCEAAHDCPHLAAGDCPLTVGRGEVLNSMGIRVLRSVRHLVCDRGRVYETGEQQAEGKPIWFAALRVVSDVSECGGHI